MKKNVLLPKTSALNHEHVDKMKWSWAAETQVWAAAEFKVFSHLWNPCCCNVCRISHVLNSHPVTEILIRTPLTLNLQKSGPSLRLVLPFCLGLSLETLDSGISHPVEKLEPVSAWEPEGSCRGRERTGPNLQTDHAVRRTAQGKKTGRFCPHLYPESFLCRSGLRGLALLHYGSLQWQGKRKVSVGSSWAPLQGRTADVTVWSWIRADGEKRRLCGS